jgi:hypothetical protein
MLKLTFDRNQFEKWVEAVGRSSIQRIRCTSYNLNGSTKEEGIEAVKVQLRSFPFGAYLFIAVL